MRYPLGACCTVRATGSAKHKHSARHGGAKRTRILGSAYGYLSAGPATAEFGLGTTSAIDSIDVNWPDGSKETFPGGAADRAVELRKGTGSKR